MIADSIMQRVNLFYLLIEQVAEKALLLVMAAVMVTLMLVMVLIVLLSGGVTRLLRIRLSWLSRRGAFDNLVQFAPVQPDAAALRTKINFNTLTFCDLQRDITDGTIHDSSSLWVKQKKLTNETARKHNGL
jgi:hypothetical protein